MAKSNDFRTITFKTTENEFSKEVLDKIREFYSIQKSKQVSIGLMTQFFIEHVGMIDLGSYEGVKILTQSKIASSLKDGQDKVEESITQVLDKEMIDNESNHILQTKHSLSNNDPHLVKPDNEDNDTPGREDF